VTQLVPFPASIACLAWAATGFVLGPGSARATEPSSAPAEIRSEAPMTAVRLFAGVEEAWAQSDAERLTSLVDSTSVRIALKPGAPLTSALTRVAAAFLLQDQLRLVHTREFQVTRFDCDKKGRFCRATAVWTGDWGGRQGNRSVRVSLTARPRMNRWVLTEIRADD
jgi:hypothetical protein